MKTLVIIPREPPARAPKPKKPAFSEKERRQNQRRMAVPRRVQDGRRSSKISTPKPVGRRNRNADERRDAWDRRRLPDRRLGLNIVLDIDFSELE